MKLPRMTVYSKTLIIFSLALLMLFSALVILAKEFMLGQFEATEIQQTTLAVGRIAPLLASKKRAVAAMVTEASSSETPEMEAVLRPRAADAQALDFLFLSHGGGWRELLGRAVGGAPEIALPEDQTERNGFLPVGGRLAFVSLQTPPEGPRGRAMLGGRFLGALDYAAIREFTGGDLRFTSLAEAMGDNELRERLRSALGVSGPLVEVLNADTLRAYVLVRSIEGHVLGVFTLDLPRVLYREGLRAFSFFLVGLAVAGGGLVFVTWFLLDTTLLTRIRDLEARVVSAKSKGNPPTRLGFRGNDELASLASSIEDLANSVMRAEENYRNVVMDQTELIARFGPGLELQFSNSACARFIDNGAARGQSMFEIFHPSHRKQFKNSLQGLSPDHTVCSVLLRGRVESGAPWLQTTIRARFDEAGEFLGGQLVAFDVTEQRKAEEELAASEREMRYLSARLLRLQDEERRRIARELHDSTAQYLSALEMNMALLEKNSDRKDVLGQRLLRESREIAVNCSREIRTMSYLLHPPLLDEVGLAFALRWFCDGFDARTGIHVDLQVPEDLGRLAPDVEMALFRVTQECLTNIYRHAETKAAWVFLVVRGHGIELEIGDKGRGFDVTEIERDGTESVTPGVGLSGMRERMRQLGGGVEIRSDSQGTLIRAMVPDAGFR